MIFTTEGTEITEDSPVSLHALRVLRGEPHA
jgi:hypothetical protein